MRFLCDEMLARLARLLRAAGHDTALAEPGQPDAELVEIARAQGRVLVTRDRRLAAASAGLLLRGDSVAEQALEMSRSFGIDWQAAPFTRCVMDNTPLRPANAEEVAAMPEGARALPGAFNTCPVCGRLYWPGSHVKRMAARLEALNRSGGRRADG